MTQFHSQGFEVVKKYALPYFSAYLRHYFALIVQNDPSLGGDSQAPNSHCVYGDPAFDLAMIFSREDIGQIVGKNLIPQYTYARIYNKGSDLKIHSDRPECQYSVTLSLGGEYDKPWPIWIKDRAGKSHEVPLEEGDMLVYSGCELEHWREEFEGETQYQLFMHYVDADGEFKDRVFDGRSNIGLKK